MRGQTAGVTVNLKRVATFALNFKVMEIENKRG